MIETNTFIKLNEYISSTEEDFKYFDKLPKQLQDYLDFDCVVNMSSKHIYELHEYGVPSDMIIMLVNQQLENV